MKLRHLYIISCFLLSVFVSKEVIADARLIHTEQKECCENGESSNSNTEKNAEERGFEQEQKLLTDALPVPSLIANILLVKIAYKAPYIPTIEIGIVTPPPKAV